MKGGKKKSAVGVSGSSNFDPTNESQPDNAAAFGDFEEMPVSDAAAAMEEYNQEQQQRQRRLEKGKELLLQNEEDFIEEYEYYEDVERSMYDRFNHLEISQDSDGQAVGGDCDGDGDGGNEEEVADERPKLAEGFYEIEAVRKKRTRKGVAQYLIKWRGWPETANTWEPLVNLQSCSDVIEAFEESLQLSGKGKAGRKRKRKHGVTPQPQSKKKPQQQQQSQHRKKGPRLYNNLPAVMVTLNEESLAPPPSAPMTVSLNAVEETNVDGAVNSNSGETAKQGDENKNGTEVISSPQVEERRETDLSEPIGSRFGDDPDHNEGAAQTNGVVPSVDGNEAGQSGRRVGARRRKSGAVKRLNVELSSSHPVDNGQVAPPIRMGSTNGIQNGGLGSNMSDTHVITEIIKAIDYSRPTSDTTTQEVAVTFMAKRSDGTEVVVTNKYLKAHFPLLLIDYYEQNLRYSLIE